MTKLNDKFGVYVNMLCKYRTVRSQSQGNDKIKRQVWRLCKYVVQIQNG